MRLRLLDNAGKATTPVGWALGTEKGAFSLILATLAICLLLMGCGPIASAGSIAPPVAAAPAAAPIKAAADRVIVEGGRALILANLAYQTVGTAAAVTIEAGWVKGETKARVQAASQRAVDALSAGERAILAGDKATNAVAALAAIDDLCKLHPFIRSACERIK